MVSLIIPVRNDASRLRACLRAVEQQTYPLQHVEIIVVDNASQDDIAAVQQQFSAVTFVTESQLGPAAARNAGLQVARGEIIAFLDADCVPSEDWLERGVHTLLKTPHCGLVGGRVIATFARPKPSLVERYDAITYCRQRWNVEHEHFAGTANLFTRRAVLETVGVFDSEHFAAALEDIDWGLRVHQAGFTQVYAHDAVVAHPAKTRLSEIVHKQYLFACYYPRLVAKHSWQRGAIFARTFGTPGSRLRTLWAHRLASGVQKLPLFMIYVYESLTQLWFANRFEFRYNRIP